MDWRDNAKVRGCFGYGNRRRRRRRGDFIIGRGGIAHFDGVVVDVKGVSRGRSVNGPPRFIGAKFPVLWLGVVVVVRTGVGKGFDTIHPDFKKAGRIVTPDSVDNETYPHTGSHHTEIVIDTTYGNVGSAGCRIVLGAETPVIGGLGNTKVEMGRFEDVAGIRVIVPLRDDRTIRV